MAETFQRFSGPTQEQSLLLDLIANQQFPSRMGGWYDALQQFTQRANASPQALSALTSPQLQQMAQALMAAQRGLSTQLGPWGGAQIPAALGQMYGSQPWLSTFLNPVMGAQGNLQKFLGGTSLIMPGGQVSQSTSTQPTSPNEWMQALQGLTFLGGGLYSAWPRGGGGMGASPGLEKLF